jgi:hypothetical protein
MLKVPSDTKPLRWGTNKTSLHFTVLAVSRQRGVAPAPCLELCFVRRANQAIEQ